MKHGIPSFFVASLALTLGHSACQSSPPPTAAPVEVVAVPADNAGGDEFFLFRAGGVERRTERESLEDEPIAVEAGSPWCAAVDIAAGYAAVAYEDRIGVAELTESQLDWIDLGTSSPPALIGVGGELAALVRGTHVAMLDLYDGAVLWSDDIAGWLDAYDLDQLFYVQPVSRDEFLLVGFRPMSMVGDSEAVVQRVDRSRGDWQEVANYSISGLSWVQRCTSDGQGLYVAGVREVRQRTGIGTEQLRQTLKVFRYDIEKNSSRPVVTEDLHEIETRVSQIAARDDLLAVSLDYGDSGEVRVYRVSSTSGRPIWEKRFAKPPSVAFLGSDRLVIVQGSSIELARDLH